MTLDAALLACYAARPSLQLLVLGGFLAALRWVPPFAAIVAQALRVPEWGGLSMPVALFALPGLQAYTVTPAFPRAATAATTRLQSPEPPQARPALARIPLTELLLYVNARPDEVPHLAIIGPSGSGKTTMATAILASRPGQIVVLTAKEGDTWGGLPYVGIDDDATYTSARRTFDALNGAAGVGGQRQRVHRAAQLLHRRAERAGCRTEPDRPGRRLCVGGPVVSGALVRGRRRRLPGDPGDRTVADHGAYPGGADAVYARLHRGRRPG